MKILKSYLLLLAIALISSPISAQNDGKFEIPLSEPNKRGLLKVDIKVGSINVEGYDGKTVLITYVAKGKNLKSKQKSKDGLLRIPGSTLDLEVTEHENQVIVDSNSYSKGVDLTIKVPREFDINVDTYNDGNIYVNNIKGEVVAENYNGSITLDNISGLGLADTYNGDIKIRFNELIPGKPLAYNSYNGDIDITLPDNVKSDFKMKTTQGEIYSAFDMSLKQVKPESSKDNKSGVYKVKINEWVRGSVNGGGAVITISTRNGDILLRKKSGN